MHPHTIQNELIVFSIWLAMPEQFVSSLVGDLENPVVLLTMEDIRAIERNKFLHISRFAKECTRKYNKDPKQRYRST